MYVTVNLNYIAKTTVAPLDRVKVLFQTNNPEYTKLSSKQRYSCVCHYCNDEEIPIIIWLQYAHLPCTSFFLRITRTAFWFGEGYLCNLQEQRCQRPVSGPFDAAGPDISICCHQVFML